jgi:hypothetical protein
LCFATFTTFSFCTSSPALRSLLLESSQGSNSALFTMTINASALIQQYLSSDQQPSSSGCVPSERIPALVAESAISASSHLN